MRARLTDSVVAEERGCIDQSGGAGLIEDEGTRDQSLGAVAARGRAIAGSGESSFLERGVFCFLAPGCMQTDGRGRRSRFGGCVVIKQVEGGVGERSAGREQRLALWQWGGREMYVCVCSYVCVCVCMYVCMYVRYVRPCLSQVYMHTVRRDGMPVAGGNRLSKRGILRERRDEG